MFIFGWIIGKHIYLGHVEKWASATFKQVLATAMIITNP